MPRDHRRRVRWTARLSLVLLVLLLSTAVSPARSSAAPNGVTVTFGASGDHGDSPRAAAVLRAAGGSKLDFFQNLGDLSYGPRGKEALWCQFVKDNLNAGAGLPKGDAYGEMYPFMLATGNHETREASNGSDIDNFTPCLPNRLSAQSVMSPNLGTGTDNYAKEYYYDFPRESPLMRMIVTSPGIKLNSNGPYEYKVGNAHYAWLASAIDSARAAGIRWVVVAQHKQYITEGNKVDEIGSDFFNLLVSKRVDLILQGHDHSYQRSKQLAHSAACPAVTAVTADLDCIVADGADGTYTKGAGPVLVISAVGGDDDNTMKADDGEAPYFARAMGVNSTDNTYGFTKVTVTETELTSTFVPGVGLDEGFRDTFTIKDSSQAVTLPDQAAGTRVSVSGPCTAAPEASLPPPTTPQQRLLVGVGLELTCPGTGATARVTIDLTGSVPRDGLHFEWSPKSVVAPKVEVSATDDAGQTATRITYLVTDGGVGDADGVADGRIRQTLLVTADAAPGPPAPDSRGAQIAAVATIVGLVVIAGAVVVLVRRRRQAPRRERLH